MSTSNEMIAKQILDAVGGADNVISIANCMTRLRFTLKDKSKAKKDILEKIEGVKGVVFMGGQYQIVMGNQANDIYRIYTKNEKINEKKDTQQTVQGKTPFFDRVMDTISGSVTPIIPIIVTGGLLQALALLLSTLNVLSANSETYKMIMFIGQAAYYFLPVFLGYSAAKKMNTNTALGMFLGAVLLYPDLMTAIASEEGFHFFGLAIPAVAYSSTIIPILLGVWVMSYVEKFINRFMFKSIKNLLTPLLTILIMVPITLMVLGPLGAVLGSYLASLFNLMANSNLGWLVVMIMAGLFPIIVMMGVHVMFYPLVLNALATSGFDLLILPAGLAYNTACAAVALAVAVKSKNKALKASAYSASVSGFLGITEPSLYGVALRLKRPMVGLIAGAAVGGLLAGILHFKVYYLTLVGLLALPTYVDDGNNFLYAILIMVVTTVVTFLITYFYGFEDIKESE